MEYKKQTSHGFTIIELLVVIVVIGVLAAITIVSYTGISQRAISSSLQSDLDNASRQLKLFQIDNSNYPATIDCTIPNSATNKCIKSSNGTTLYYSTNNTSVPQTFNITAINGVQVYNISQDGTAILGGKNLLVNSQNLQTTPNWAGAGTAVKMNDETIPYWRVTGTTQISTYEGPIYSLPLIIGATYTISCEVRVPVAGSVGFYAGRGMNAGVPANIWARIYYTFTYSSAYRIGGNTYGSSQLDYRNWKVEIGNVATDWTP